MIAVKVRSINSIQAKENFVFMNVAREYVNKGGE